MSTKEKKITGDFYISCPYCNDIVYITQINCAIFLHAYNNKTEVALNPHTKRHNIEKLSSEGKLGGCGGRFNIKIDPDQSIISTKLFY
jgi:adenine C2-methylase RlmN of 23S rRNA A2503 and tRNA A37